MRGNFKIPYDEIEKRLERALTEAAAEVEAAAKEKAPVDTGNLRKSINHSVSYPEASIGSNVDYAPYVENGTGRSVPQPFLEPAIQSSKNKILNCFKNIF